MIAASQDKNSHLPYMTLLMMGSPGSHCQFKILERMIIEGALNALGSISCRVRLTMTAVVCEETENACGEGL